MKTVKIALYKDVKWDFVFANEASEHRETSKSDVRISEIVEVEFPMLSVQETVEKEMVVIDAAEQELRDKFADAVAGLNEKRAALLALTHQGES